jgi:carbon storage regulator
MLNLKRSLSESIQIGDDIIITVLNISGSHVDLGIDAPRDVVIVRQEVLERAAKRAASVSASLPARTKDAVHPGRRSKSESSTSSPGSRHPQRKPKVIYKRRLRISTPDKG